MDIGPIVICMFMGIAMVVFLEWMAFALRSRRAPRDPVYSTSSSMPVIFPLRRWLTPVPLVCHWALMSFAALGCLGPAMYNMNFCMRGLVTVIALVPMVTLAWVPVAGVVALIVCYGKNDWGLAEEMAAPFGNEQTQQPGTSAVRSPSALRR